jgi:putative phage-type endonuclease
MAMSIKYKNKKTGTEFYLKGFVGNELNGFRAKIVPAVGAKKASYVFECDFRKEFEEIHNWGIENTTELEQGSDDWFNARIGRVTASNVGAILGLSPFRTRDQVMRAMVREWHGALNEFTGNVATEYGNMNEHLARTDYQLKTGNIVETTGFHTHDLWLGASPDGFIEDGIIEIKCPYSLRNGGEFKSIEEQPHYYAQIQIQMFVTKTPLCDFVQWHKDGIKIETVKYDICYVAAILPKLKAFYDEFLEELHNPAHLKSRHDVVESDLMNEKVLHYLELKQQSKSFSELADEMLKQIIEDCGENESVIGDHKLTRVNRKSIGYAKAVKDLLPDADLSAYESTTSYWTLK